MTDKKARLGEEWIFHVLISGVSGHLLEPLDWERLSGSPFVHLLFLWSPHLVHHFCLGESSVTLVILSVYFCSLALDENC